MSNWKSILDISDIHYDYENEKLTASQVGQKVAERVEKLGAFSGCKILKDIVKKFQAVDNIDNYDDILELLYEYGDYMQLRIKA